MIVKLYKKINWDKEEFDAIVSINRGGNIIGTLLSHKTRLPLQVIHKGDVVDLRGKVLLVDDISDTGATLMKVISNLKTGTEFKIATLHMKASTRCKPDFCVSEVSHWVVYPYERVRKHKKEGE
jgi:hypoxanthine phosphoribosyltransferase